MTHLDGTSGSSNSNEIAQNIESEMLGGVNDKILDSLIEGEVEDPEVVLRLDPFVQPNTFPDLTSGSYHRKLLMEQLNRYNVDIDEPSELETSSPDTKKEVYEGTYGGNPVFFIVRTRVELGLKLAGFWGASLDDPREQHKRSV